MIRYKLVIEYDGRFFAGWQRQEESVPSVQAAVENAVLAFSGEKVVVEGAGRTDSGVHALGQIGHVDLSVAHPPYRIANALNFYLRDSGVAILDVQVVDATFHARFSATARQYEYHIINRRSSLTVDAGRAWQVIPVLNVELMQEAAQLLVGHHDFNSFRSSACQATSSLRTLDVFTIRRQGERIIATVKSRSFLHNQVRIMMGSLKLIGAGKWTADDLVRVLDACDRTKSGPTAPACGLYLTGVEYNKP